MTLSRLALGLRGLNWSRNANLQSLFSLLLWAGKTLNAGTCDGFPTLRAWFPTWRGSRAKRRKNRTRALGQCTSPAAERSYGDVPIEDSMELLRTETIRDQQAKTLADRFEVRVEMLKALSMPEGEPKIRPSHCCRSHCCLRRPQAQGLLESQPRGLVLLAALGVTRS